MHSGYYYASRVPRRHCRKSRSRPVRPKTAAPGCARLCRAQWVGWKRWVSGLAFRLQLLLLLEHLVHRGEVVLVGEAALRLLQPDEADQPAEEGPRRQDVEELGRGDEGEEGQVDHRPHVAVGAGHAGDLAGDAALDRGDDRKSVV